MEKIYLVEKKDIASLKEDFEKLETEFEALKSETHGAGDSWEIINDVSYTSQSESNSFVFSLDRAEQPFQLKRALLLYAFPKYEGTSDISNYCFASLNGFSTGANAPAIYTSAFQMPSKTVARISGFWSVEALGGTDYWMEYSSRYAGNTGDGVFSSSSNASNKLIAYRPGWGGTITSIGLAGGLVYSGCRFILMGVRA